ncbi:MAG TPA: FAD binding domain-containing protein [Clostridia bacterium]|nr:FAD binding domain-containing protein [Clostridia bacterium]
MKAFEYASPVDVNQVSVLLERGKGAILAGGTDLLALIKGAVVEPKRLVNIKSIEGLEGVASSKGGLRIGALARLQDLADNAIIRTSYPALAEALDEAASPQIRNMATIGGNLLQRPRCWYFRSGFGLLALDSTGESLVLKGDNRYHAILGNDGPAYFVSPSTIAPALIAYDAKVTILGNNGKRRITPLQDLYRIPKQREDVEHALTPGEVLTEINIPPAAANTKAAVYEVRQKHAFDWPLATAAVVLRMNGNTVQSARVAMGHVAPIPWISTEAEAVLAGKPLNEQTIFAAASAAVQKAKSLGQNGHKIQCARTAVKRAIMKAAGLPVA